MSAQAVRPSAQSVAKKTRWWLVFAVFGVFILSVGLVVGGYWWFLGRQARVVSGAARPNFPYRDYSVDELNKLYPQYLNEDVATTRSPEETHDLFVAALRKGDFDEAVNCCFRAGDREKTLGFLNGVKEKGMLDLMIGDITRDFRRDMMLDTMATYVYNGTLNGSRSGSMMTFRKASNGIWYIESL
jgi:hypothetical protein